MTHPTSAKKQKLPQLRMPDTEYTGDLYWWEPHEYEDEYHIDFKCNEATYGILSGVFEDALGESMYTNIIHDIDGYMRILHVPNMYLKYVIITIAECIAKVEKGRHEAVLTDGKLYSNDIEQLRFMDALSDISEKNRGSMTVKAD